MIIINQEDYRSKPHVNMTDDMARVTLTCTMHELRRLKECFVEDTIKADDKMKTVKVKPDKDKRFFNINGYVKVKLTDKGREILKKEHESLVKEFGVSFIGDHPFLPTEDENGYGEWQLWRLMETFGKHIYMGCDPPFETTIEIIYGET